MLINNLKRVFQKKGMSAGERFSFCKSNVLEVRNIDMLFKAMGWQERPILNDEILYEFKYLEDLNDRRLRDAEVVHSACSNGRPKTILEVGTSEGRTTALMAKNAPQATIYTINILPEEISEGGNFTTHALEKEKIGWVYRSQGIENVQQIYANTATWKPNIGTIDVAFIDGCHDAEFVYNDTKKILEHCRPGSLIMWHDFNPELVNVYPWIGDVCRGIQKLYMEKILTGKILHLQDSWVGLYKV